MTDWEAIIVNDASPDKTQAIAEKLAADDSRVRVFRLEKNGGPAAARNTGMAHARGEWIAILDADDAYTPRRLEALLSEVSSGGWDLVFDNMASLSNKSDSMPPYWPEWRGRSSVIPLAEMLRGCSGVMQKPYGILKPFIRRSFWMSAHLSYDEKLKRGEDVLFHIGMMLQGAKTGRVCEVGYLYESPDSNNKSNASLSNLQHSHAATLQVKSAGWHKMNLVEKFWLSVRAINTTEPEVWSNFGSSLKDKKIGRAVFMSLQYPSILKKLFISKPLKSISNLMP